MKASEVVRQLTELINKIGDKDVKVIDDGEWIDLDLIGYIKVLDHFIME